MTSTEYPYRIADSQRGGAVSLRVLHEGDLGPDVTVLQNQLIELEYLGGPATGVFGSSTHRALASFQHDYGLHADAVCGPKVRDALRQLTHRSG